MRSLLNKLYLASGYLSGGCIVLITLIITAQIVARLFGFIVPSAEDFSGYALAAATFFGLAYTFREGGHIRVTLVIQNWRKGSRYYQELLVLLLALTLVSFMSFYAVHMVWESYIFEEVSSGYVSVPIWLPQVPVALGILMLNIAIVDDVIALLRRQSPSYQVQENELQLEDV
ncbi:TRAP transporter small permease [Amphritea sp. 2_MG-2023]|jgi:TRAP-type C4-dicarboxylate transport system permease small subunit|uniref:TRAP transporter small permease n=1 Tax=Amphritea TaxID=515417 RepID=UPI001C066C12|nr:MULTISPECIES: TRAP transporter small permease [Amphritea]MBU2965370.1 TRAP transporter small permease [Amphritea atlantica]MDO6420015.1 TRAP transporter small permease [Amphritea sp. 2_MG-2023]MDX2424130.1 TRAP transporter small permease [Amphritea sp.]